MPVTRRLQNRYVSEEIGNLTVKTAPPSAPILGRGLAPVQFDEVLHDRKSEAGAAGPRARLVHAIEALEHPRQILRRNAGARIGDGDRVGAIDACRAEP